MKEYNITLPNYTDFEKTIQKETNFFRYMELLRQALPNYILIITVRDTPTGMSFSPNHSLSMMQSLGLKMNMQQAFRMPYVAIIDHGNVVYENTSKDLKEPVIVNGNLGKHSIMIYSGGFDSDADLAVNAAVYIDDIHYYGYRGYNFFLYNTEKDYMADISEFDTYPPENKKDASLHKPFLIMNDLLINRITTRGGGYFAPSKLQIFPL